MISLILTIQSNDFMALHFFSTCLTFATSKNIRIKTSYEKIIMGFNFKELAL